MKQKNKKPNNYKRISLIFIVLLIVLGGYNFYEAKKVYAEEEKQICSSIKGTPAWLNSLNEVVYYGVLGTYNQSEEKTDEMVSKLIEKRVKFVYNSDCSACKIQLEIFGENNWEKYQREGYTLNCKEVWDDENGRKK